MPIYLSNNPESIVQFQYGMPLSYSGPLLKGSKVLQFAKDTWQIIIQEIITEFYTLRINVFRFLKTLTLNSLCRKEGIYSRILLKGNLHHRVMRTGRINLREGKFVMLWAEGANCKCRFEKNVEYRTLEISYSSQLLKHLVPFFHELKHLERDEHPKQLVNNPCFITPAMRDITRQILECPFDETTR